MAKVRHRIFEMYELRDEAIRALTPKSAQPTAETNACDSWKFKHLAVLRSANTAHVQFKGEQTLDETTVSELREDLTQLADRLVKDSRVLLDFTAVESFDAASIKALDQFNQKLKTKGSRIALCCLDPKVQRSFFERSNGHE